MKSKNSTKRSEPDELAGLEVFSATVDKTSDVLGLILSQWYFIAKNLVITAVAVIVILLLIPSSYKSSSQVGIFPPQFSSEVQEKPLTVMTAKEILKAPELVNSVIVNMQNGRGILDSMTKRKPVDAAFKMIMNNSPADIINEVESADMDTVLYLKSLKRDDLTGLMNWKAEALAELTVDELSKQLDCEEIEEKKTAIDVIYSPLIRLTAVADDGKKAMLLANTWSYVFERKYLELTSQKQSSMVRFLEEQQNESQAELEDIETSIVLLKARHNLGLYKTQIDAYASTSANWTQQLLTKRNQLMSQSKSLRMLTRQRNIMTSGSEFLGKIDSVTWESPMTTEPVFTMDVPQVELSEYVAPTKSADEDTSEMSVRDLANMSGLDMKELSGLEEALMNVYRDQTMTARMNREKNLQEIQAFEKKYPVEMMEMDLNARQKEILDLHTQLNSEKVQLASSQKTLTDVERGLALTSQTLYLQRAVPAEAMVQATVMGNSGKLSSLPNFYNEELNPTWVALTDRRNSLIKDIEQFTNNIAEISLALPERESALEKQSIELRKVRELNKVFGENLDKWNKTSDHYYTEFMNLNQQITTFASSMISLRVEIEQLVNDLSFALEMADTTQRKYDSAQMQLSLLEVRKGVLQKKADLLMNKYHQALIAERKNVNDVSFASRAIAPTRHFFPLRSVFFAAAMMLAFMMLCAAALHRSLRFVVSSKSSVSSTTEG